MPKQMLLVRRSPSRRAIPAAPVESETTTGRARADVGHSFSRIPVSGPQAQRAGNPSVEGCASKDVAASRSEEPSPETHLIQREQAWSLPAGMQRALFAVDPPRDLLQRDDDDQNGTSAEQSADTQTNTSGDRDQDAKDSSSADGTGSTDASQAGSDDLPPALVGADLSGQMSLPPPDPQTFTLEQVQQLVPSYTPSDTDGPSGILMTFPAGRQVQRADPAPPGGTPAPGDTPHLGGDLQLNYPWSLQGSLVYRNFNLATLHDLLGKDNDLELFHEPQVSLQVTPDAAVGEQLAVGIMNQHIKLFSGDYFNEIEVQTLAQWNSAVGSTPQNYSGNEQAELHVYKNFSLTGTVSGTWTPPAPGRPGTLEFGGSVGLLWHIAP